MNTYKIIRFYQRSYDREVIVKGLTLEQAKEHCSDKETSSKTCTTPEGKERTALKGELFDGYEEE